MNFLPHNLHGCSCTASLDFQRHGETQSIIHRTDTSTTNAMLLEAMNKRVDFRFPWHGEGRGSVQQGSNEYPIVSHQNMDR